MQTLRVDDIVEVAILLPFEGKKWKIARVLQIDTNKVLLKAMRGPTKDQESWYSFHDLGNTWRDMP